MSDEEYFSEKYRDYISNSRLGLLNPSQDGSFVKYKEGFQGSYSDSFELGSAIHCMLLQPDDFKISDLDKPTGKLGLFVEEVLLQRKAGAKIQTAIDVASQRANYYAKGLGEKRTKTAIQKGLDYYLKKGKEDTSLDTQETLYLSKPMKEKLYKCLDSAEKDKAFMGKLNPDCLIIPVESYNEYAIFCEAKVTIDEEEHIIKLKGKLDNFTVDHEMGVITLNDLKSTGKPTRFFMGNYVTDYTDDTKEYWINGSFQKYHYHRQIALYLWLLHAALEKQHGYDYELKANMLLVETVPEFGTKICKVNGTHITKGLEEFKELIIYLIKHEQK